MKFLVTLLVCLSLIAGVFVACSDDDTNGSNNSSAVGMSFDFVVRGSAPVKVKLACGFNGSFTNGLYSTKTNVVIYNGEAMASFYTNNAFGEVASRRFELAAWTSLMASTAPISSADWTGGSMTQDYLIIREIGLGAAGTTPYAYPSTRLSNAYYLVKGVAIDRNMYSTENFTMTISEYGPVGGLIKGTFSFTLQTNYNATNGIVPIVITNGVFQMRRVADTCSQLNAK